MQAWRACWRGLSDSSAHSSFFSVCFAQSRGTVVAGMDEELGEKEPGQKGKEGGCVRCFAARSSAQLSLLVLLQLRAAPAHLPSNSPRVSALDPLGLGESALVSVACHPRTPTEKSVHRSRVSGLDRKINITPLPKEENEDTGPSRTCFRPRSWGVAKQE